MKLLDLVALLAEGVDRNFWFFSALFKASKVALLAEGVDRNSLNGQSKTRQTSRPPRGGRG